MVEIEGLLRRYKLSLISDNELESDEKIIVDIIIDRVARYERVFRNTTDDTCVELKYVKQRYVTDILEKIKNTNLLKNTNIDLSEWFD